MVAAASSLSTACDAFTAFDLESAEHYLERFLLGVDISDTIDGRWRLSDALPPRAGAVILNLSHDDGRIIRIDVCRRGQHPVGPVYTGDLDFVVMDGGSGKAVYDDELQVALMVLAEKIQKNQYAYRLSESLLSHSERLDAFPHVMSRAAQELAPTPVQLDRHDDASVI